MVMGQPHKTHGYVINLSLSMGRFLMCGCKGKSYINQGQWLETQARVKRDVTGRAMKSSVIAMINIRKALIPYVGMFRIVHSHNMHNHPIDYLYFSICLGVEGSRFSDLGIHQ